MLIGMSNPRIGEYASLGGRARALSLTPRERQLIARLGALSRWRKVKAKTPKTRAPRAA